MYFPFIYLNKYTHNSKIYVEIVSVDIVIED